MTSFLIFSTVTSALLDKYREKGFEDILFIDKKSLLAKIKCLWDNCTAIVNKKAIPNNGKKEAAFMRELDQIEDVLSCK